MYLHKLKLSTLWLLVSKSTERNSERKATKEKTKRSTAVDEGRKSLVISKGCHLVRTIHVDTKKLKLLSHKYMCTLKEQTKMC